MTSPKSCSGCVSNYDSNNQSHILVHRASAKHCMCKNDLNPWKSNYQSRFRIMKTAQQWQKLKFIKAICTLRDSKRSLKAVKG